ncbi:hypothetical protein ACJ41O_010217 [Fusarium nematophilum]
MPCLPEHLSRSNVVYGRPRWHFSPDVLSSRSATENQQEEDGMNTTMSYGRRLWFHVRWKDPVRYEISPEAASYSMGMSTQTTNSLAILTLCWSYILSVRLLEMQGRMVEYSNHRLWPQSHGLQGQSIVDLEGASPSLVRWLCAILSPKLGWCPRGFGQLPVWLTTFTEDVQVSLASPIMAAEIDSAPSSSEATELLIELCQLFRLGTNLAEASDWEPMQPYKAAFLAALMVPFYNSMKLRPRLPIPHLPRVSGSGVFTRTHKQAIRGYTKDLRYFMTLSLHTSSLGSVLWSVFWQPEVDCNLVGPWLTSILDTLEPTINEKRVETLLKVFVARRPRVAIWWMALFLLGDLTLLDWIRRYAQKLLEKWGFGTSSPPDPIIAAWTGSKQSFLDLDKDSLYTEESDAVPRADVLRCRFDLKLQDYASTLLAWRPFGYMRKAEVEPDLWPQLETKYTRRYHSFVWYHSKKPMRPDRGFRNDTGRDVKNVPDDLELRPSSVECRDEEPHCRLYLRPSRILTRTMMSFLVEDGMGGRHWANAALPVKLGQLRWLRDWEGLASGEQPLGEEDIAKDVGGKPPSWFLEEWVRGRWTVDSGEQEAGVGMSTRVG